MREKYSLRNIDNRQRDGADFILRNFERENSLRNIDNRQRPGADCILRNWERKNSLRDIGSRQLARVELIIIAITVFLIIYLTRRRVTLNILFAWGNISNILPCLCLKVRPEATL